MPGICGTERSQCCPGKISCGTKYIHMEEVLQNVANARQIFERWMQWEPDKQAWLSYIKFELRYGEVDRARSVFQRFVRCRPRPDTFIRLAKFEMKRGEVARARQVYEHAVDLLADDDDAESLLVAFAQFEERCKELERARLIYKFALDHVPKGRADELYQQFLAFEKQYGNKEGIEDATAGKRRLQYESEVKRDPQNYDSWFDYIRLDESLGRKDAVREVYERAIGNVPPAEEKRYWQLYLWINYSLYKELDAQDMEKTREVYSACLKLIPHQKFSFAKIWLLAAQFEIRQGNLSAARQILGNAIGVAAKDKIFKKYIEIELQLCNIERVRKLYQKYLEWSPGNCYAWLKYADLEKSLGETDRARAAFELAVAQPALDMPEQLWKAYIDFEVSQGEYENTRRLYERLLDRTKHLKVWSSYAKFEALAGLGEKEGDEETGGFSKISDANSVEMQHDRIQRCRAVFERAYRYFSSDAPELKEERVMLLEDWLKTELQFGTLGDADSVKNKMPTRVKRRRPIYDGDGTPAGLEEYYDYSFADEDAMAPNLQILQAALRWKKQMVHDALLPVVY